MPKSPGYYRRLSLLSADTRRFEHHGLRLPFTYTCAAINISYHRVQRRARLLMRAGRLRVQLISVPARDKITSHFRRDRPARTRVQVKMPCSNFGRRTAFLKYKMNICATRFSARRERARRAIIQSMP